MSSSNKQERRRVVLGALGTMALGGLGIALAGSAPEGQGESDDAIGAGAAPLAMRPILRVLSPRGLHWVGDGFHVTTVFSPHQVDAELISPFVLLDHGAPSHFPPSTKPRGVGPHPHRGFETVTFAYQGEVDHRDSYGGGGTISAGDVQWMTAASGVVHEEMHSAAFTQSGGAFEMVQLWVNLPAALKMTAPRYQALPGSSFPELSIGAATARVIAGTLSGKRGPAKTHSPITLFDLTFASRGASSFTLDEGATILLLVLRGQARAQGERDITMGDLVITDRAKPGAITLFGEAGTRVLVLSGAPLGEPVVAQGPFVMNTREEIAQAVEDYNQGKMGQLRPTI